MLKYSIIDFKNNIKNFVVIFISLSLTVVSIICCKSFGDSIIETRNMQLRNQTLNSQILISAENNGTFDASKIKKKLDKFENVDYVLERCYFRGSVENTTEIYLYGVDIEKQQEVYELKLIDGSFNFDEENGIICSETYSKYNKVKIDDSLLINVEGIQQEFVIKAIVEDNDFFLYDNLTVICNIKKIQTMLHLDNDVNRIDVTLKDLKDIDKSVENIEKALENEGVIVTSKYQTAYYESYVSTIQLALEVFLVFNIVLSLFIIFSTIKSYTVQKIEMIATLRSIGTSVRQCKNMILLEMMIVLILAGVVGIVVSIPFIQTMMYYFIGQSGSIVCDKRAVILIGSVIFLFCIFVTEISINKVMKISITSMLKNDKQERNKINLGRRSIITLAAIAIMSIMYQVCLKSTIFYYVIAVIILAIFILVYPVLIKLIAIILGRVFQRSGKIIKIVMKQLETTLLSLHQPMVIISLVICVSAISSMVSYGMEISMETVYKGADVEIVGNQDVLHEVKSEIDKEKTVVSYTIQKRKQESVDGNTIELSGIIVEQYAKQNYETVIGSDHLSGFRKLKKKNTVIISSTLAKSINKKTGDFIKIGEMEKLEIVAIVDTFENKGMLAFVSEDTFQTYIMEYDYFMILLSGKDNAAEKVYTSISNRLSEECGVFKVDELIKENIDDNKLIFNMIYVLCILSLIVSIIALHNCIKMNISTQIKTYIAYRTLGMQRIQIFIKLILEIIIMALVSASIGICICFAEINNIKTLLSYYIGSIRVGMKIETIGGLLIIIIIASVACVICTVHKYVMTDKYMEEINKYY